MITEEVLECAKRENTIIIVVTNSNSSIANVHLAFTTFPSLFFLKKYSILFIYLYFWLRWVFVAACGLSLVAVSGGYSLLWCTGFSLWWLPLLQSTGSRRAGSVVVAQGLRSCGSQALECRLSSCGAWA